MSRQVSQASGNKPIHPNQGEEASYDDRCGPSYIRGSGCISQRNRVVLRGLWEGTPLVLLHGFSQNGQIWQQSVFDFSQHYQLIIPDIRGHGRSTNPENELSHRQFALDIYALLDLLQIEQFKAIGFSSGGMILLHMATQQPTRIESMVLIGTPYYISEQHQAIIRERTPDSEHWDWEKLRQRHMYGDEQIRALLTHFHNTNANDADMNFTASQLSTITAKTLIVSGDRDAFYPVSMPVEMYNAIPNSYLWVVPNGVHGSVGSSEQTEQFANTSFLEFLQGEWA